MGRAVEEDIESLLLVVEWFMLARPPDGVFGDSTDTEPPEEVLPMRAVKALSLVVAVSMVFCRRVEL